MDKRWWDHISSLITTNSVIYNADNDENYIKYGYQQNPTVYSIINLINNAAKRVPYQILKVKDDKALKQYKSMTSGHLDQNSIIQSRIIKSRTFEEVDVPELSKLLDRPNPMQGWSSFIENLIGFRKLTGNGYIWALSPEGGPNQGRPKELHVLPSQCVEIISGGMQKPIKAYKLSYNPTKEIDSEEICHIKDFNPVFDNTASHLYGQSPLKAGYRTLETNNEATDTGKKMLQNQASRGILTPKNAGELTETQGKQLNESLQSRMKESRGGVAMTAVPVDWINFGLSVTDLALIEQYKLTVADLCNIYGIPDALLNNNDSSTYNNLREFVKMLFQNAVIPELCKIRDELNNFIVPKFGEGLYLDFDYSVIPELQMDMDKLVSQLGQSHWLTGNERRMAMNYGADEDNEIMNEYLIPQGMVPSSDLSLGSLLGDDEIKE